MTHPALKEVLKAGKRPKGMAYGDYSNAMKANNEDAEDEETFKKRPEADEDEGDDAADKAQVGIDDLLKSIKDYEAVEGALAEAGGSRESYLKARLDAGTITKSEQTELGRIWAGNDTLAKGGDPKPTAPRTVAGAVTEGEDGAQLMDASAFLKSMVDGIDGRLDDVLGEVTRDGRATRELLKAQGGLVKGLANVVAHQDQLIKSLVDRLEHVERTPGKPRAVTADPRAVRGRDLAKGVNGDGNPDALSKAQVDAGFQILVKAAAIKSDDVAIDRLSHAAARYETDRVLSPGIEAAIRQVTAS